MGENHQPPSSLRVGDRERERVVAILQRALADGRLTRSELDERLSSALQARTRADLEPLIVDLDRAIALPAPSRTGSLDPNLAAPGYSRADALQLDSGSRRHGTWTVPPFININQKSGWLTLDFQAANLERDDVGVIDIELSGGAGWVLFIVPVGWAVDVARLSVGWGSTSIKVSAEPAPCAPVLALHGRVGAGRLRVRHPTSRDRRRAARYFKQQP